MMGGGGIHLGMEVSGLRDATDQSLVVTSYLTHSAHDV